MTRDKNNVVSVVLTDTRPRSLSWSLWLALAACYVASLHYGGCWPGC